MGTSVKEFQVESRACSYALNHQRHGMERELAFFSAWAQWSWGEANTAGLNSTGYGWITRGRGTRPRRWDSAIEHQGKWGEEECALHFPMGTCVLEKRCLSPFSASFWPMTCMKPLATLSERILQPGFINWPPGSSHSDSWGPRGWHRIFLSSSNVDTLSCHMGLPNCVTSPK